MASQLSSLPLHVPANLIYDFDIYSAPELKRDPHASVLHLHTDAPPIFYTRCNGGHWIVTRAAEALDVLRQTDKFSSQPEYNSGLRKPWTLPNQADPPAHTEYRQIINPAFSPASVAKMESDIRSFARELIEAVVPAGGCEFVEDIAKIFPVNIFLRLVNAPLTDRKKLVEWTETAVRHPDEAIRTNAGIALGEYVMNVFAERRASHGDDLFSHVLAARVDGGRPLTEAELQAMGLLLLLGGLDTVSSMLSFIILYLARNPDQYRKLVEKPASIQQAVEELMRIHGVALMQRGATHDFEHAGVRFRKGDRLYFLPQIYGLDDRSVSDPLRVDFNREIALHLAFGAGRHRCVGSHLARVEIRVFLEEWVRQVPSFALPPGTDIVTCGGNVWSPLSVPLIWPA